MKIVLTEKVTNKEIIADADQIKMVEPANDGTDVGSHVIFGSDLGRTVNESQAAIAAAVGVIPVREVALMSASAVALAKKKR